MTSFEVPTPILNTPFEEPKEYWYIREGESPEQRPGRRPSVIYPPSDTPVAWTIDERVLRRSDEFAPGYEMVLVNLIRQRLAAWRKDGYPGVTRVTKEMLDYWRRDGRKTPLFFAQIEAAETVIFLREARQDYLQGVSVPLDEPNENQRAAGAKAFLRYALKMATGSGKTTVMGMLAAWSILNKVASRADARFSDAALVVCPNITIKNRLRELDPAEGEASLYRTRDLVPPHLMPQLSQGKVIVTNWHLFQLLELGSDAKVKKVGVPVRTLETVHIRDKTTTARGYRYLSLQDYQMQVARGMLTVRKEYVDSDGHVEKADVESVRYVESDTHWDQRVLGREIGGKQNILIMNDEAHHAYRIRREEKDEDEEDSMPGGDEDVEDFFTEATVWVEGLDRIHKMRGVNLCVDLSATPYFLGRVGQETNKPFPWVVSDFGLTDSIEAGLVKIPQLALRDTSGEERALYFNLWRYILGRLTPRERGGKRGSPKPEAILKHAHHPVAMLGGQWEETREAWQRNEDDPRPPVFIVVCKNTKIADAIYRWLANDECPSGVPPVGVPGFANGNGEVNTIRVDSKVIHETDTEGAKSDETKWMRLTLDTVGRLDWPTDRQGRPIYPEGFEELARKLGRPLHPPGRDIRCIVSVGMLTEGWDSKTVTHIIGLRPFMSQLLCEQVVGRGLRRTNYEDFDENGRLTEEVAQILGVPFEVVPYKATPEGPVKTPKKRKHVHPQPDREKYKITFPRVEGYTRAIRNRITADWGSLPKLRLDPMHIPPEVQLKASVPNNEGRPSLFGPGRIDEVTLDAYRKGRRMQELAFELAAAVTRDVTGQGSFELPAHVLFPQALQIVQRFLREYVTPVPPAELIDVFLSPYYGWVSDVLREGIRPDTSQGDPPEIPLYEQHRGPGSTAEVDFWTSKPVWPVEHSHVNYVVADTKRWEQSAAYFIDTHDAVERFVKNAGLGFAVPYVHNGEPHDYVPDFIIRLKPAGGQERYLILETKGFDELEGVKRAAAERWVQAVNADGKYGWWAYAVVHSPQETREVITSAASSRAD
ncbi:MAG: DEAD/DEAH box helicase family protein [Candidatus Brocadiaceae bacterium]|nr:DEAD/DEAH box helicase family protein [Candidatus Brocadiaceae bacterium]